MNKDRLTILKSLNNDLIGCNIYDLGRHLIEYASQADYDITAAPDMKTDFETWLSIESLTHLPSHTISGEKRVDQYLIGSGAIIDFLSLNINKAASPLTYIRKLKTIGTQFSRIYSGNKHYTDHSLSVPTDFKEAVDVVGLCNTEARVHQDSYIERFLLLPSWNDSAYCKAFLPPDSVSGIYSFAIPFGDCRICIRQFLLALSIFLCDTLYWKTDVSNLSDVKGVSGKSAPEFILSIQGGHLAEHQKRKRFLSETVPYTYFTLSSWRTRA